MSHDPTNDPSKNDPARDHWRTGLKQHLREGIHDQLPRRGSARLIVGLTIIVFGVLSLAGSIDLIDGRNPLRFFWPSVFAALGMAMLIAPRTGSDGKPVGIADRRWAFVWLFVSLWGFAYQFHWIDFGISDLIFPLLLLYVGSRLVTRAMNPDATADDTSGRTSYSPADNSHRAFAFLSGSEVRSFTQPIKSVEATAILSGVKLDLTSAVIEGDRATLNVTAIMGGIEIYAPSDWSIISEVTPIRGAYVDKRRPTANVSTKTLFIHGLVLMGGVEVKN